MFMKTNTTKHIILFLLLILLNVEAYSQSSLIIGWNETLTEEQKHSNPTYLAYPMSMKDEIPTMSCHDEPVWYFSVSTTTKVRFSHGNLQYQASTHTWRFAENQWDFVGNASEGTVYETGTKCDNVKISSYYSGWIDLFGWATSGYNTSYPYLTIYNPTKYGPSTSTIPSQYDWGVYNMYPWRTLTHTEWEYLINTRPNASQLFCKAIVHDVRGLLILPDNWVNSGEINLSFGNSLYDDNVISNVNWDIMENDGAIFLPAAGYRNVTVTDGYSIVYNYYNPLGCYWSLNYQNTQRAWALNFSSSNINSQYYYRSQGNSVRLVQNL